MRRSEGGRWKSAYKVTRSRPTQPQVRFGGGQMEKEPQGYLVSCLPNEVSEEDAQENEHSVREGFWSEPQK